MSQLPYWFTKEDNANPIHCRACKQHIPRAVYSAGKGLCPNCLSRVSSKSAPQKETMPAMASIPPLAPIAPVLPARVEKRPLPVESRDREKGLKISSPVIAVLILVAGLAIGALRLWMHV